MSMLFLKHPGYTTASHVSPTRLRWSPRIRGARSYTNQSQLSDAFVNSNTNQSQVIDALVNALAEVQEDNRMLHQKKSELERDKDQSQFQCERIQFTNYCLHDELALVHARIAKLEHRVETQHVQISEMTLELEDAQTIVTTLQDDLSAKEMRISKCKDLAARVAHLHSELSHKDAQIKEIQAEVAKKSEERNTKLNDEVRELRAKVEEMKELRARGADSDENCVICKAAPAIMLYDTCGHIATCEPCAMIWRVQSFNCPCCCQRNTVVRRVYHV